MNKLIDNKFIAFISQSGLERSARSIGFIALTWFVFTFTRSVIDLAMVSMTISVVSIISMLPIGYFIDHINRAMILSFSTITGAFAFLGLIISTLLFGFNIYLILIFSGIYALGSEMNRSTGNSILPDIKHKRFLPKANAINRSLIGGSRAISSALAGLIIISFSVLVAFFFIFSLYLLAGIISFIFIYPALRYVKTEKPLNKKNFIKDIQEGYSWLKKNKGLWNMTISAGIFNLFFGAFWGYMVVFTVNGLNSNSFIYGFIIAMFATGYLSGSLVAGYHPELKNAGKIWVIIYGLFMGLSAIIIGIANNVIITIILSIIIGLCMGYAGNTWITSAQNIVPSKIRGKYFSIDGFISSTGGALSILLGALFIILFGISRTFIIAGSLLAVSSIIYFSVKSIRNFDGSLLIENE